MTAYESFVLSQQHDGKEAQASYDEIVDEIIMNASCRGEYKVGANLESEIMSRPRLQAYTRGRTYVVNKMIEKEILRLTELGYEVSADVNNADIYIIAWDKAEAPESETE